MGKANKKSKHKGIERYSRRGKPKPNRQYKDSVFVSLFSRDEKTRRPASISLYNALHEEKISDDEKIEFIELEDVLYHKEKNDVSFMVAGKIIVLVEHQSTVNEYMEIYKNFNFYMFTLKSFTTYFIYSCIGIYKILAECSKKSNKDFCYTPALEVFVIHSSYLSTNFRRILKVQGTSCQNP